MNSKEKSTKRSDVIDVLHILKTLLTRAWAILLVGVILAGGAFAYTKVFVKEKFSSHVMLYVNNADIKAGDISISASDLSAAQSLVDTYIVILKTRTTMENVIDKMEETTGREVNYTPEYILSLVNAEAVNKTEIFKITVTTTDPDEAALIANSIASVMSTRIESIISGTTPVLVEPAVPNDQKVSPNTAKNTLIGFLVGIILGAAFFVFFAIIDDTIRSEDYIIETYEIPVLAKIPNLISDGRKYGNGTYGYSGYNGYGAYKNGGKSNEQ